jgi:hypothetical protein
MCWFVCMRFDHPDKEKNVMSVNLGEKNRTNIKW